MKHGFVKGAVILLPAIVLSAAGCSGDGGASLEGGVPAADTRADAPPLGEEFVVVSTAANGRPAGRIDIAQSATGDFAVVWRAQAGDNSGINARLFGADNVPRGDAFVVEPGEIRANVVDPAVAMDAAGNFVVAWRALTVLDQNNLLDRLKIDRSPKDIRFRRYDADGSPLGETESVPMFSGLLDLFLPPLFVPLLLTEGPVQLALAMNPDGEFVVTWLRRADMFYGSSVPAFFGAEIYGVVHARPYAADGTPKRAPVLVSAQAEHSVPPAVRMDDNAGFAVAWREGGGPLALGDEVQVRRYDADGNALAPAQTIPGAVAPTNTPLSAAMDASGNHIVAWRADGAGQAQRFDADGTPAGDRLRPTEESRENPRVAMAPGGDFAVSWSLGTEVFLRCYAANGVPRGDAFVINEAPVPGGGQPVLAYDGFGDLLVAWRRESQGDGIYEIRARRIDDC